ncbi:hypothetical protein BT67DRAFT_383226 [Trichocladium antarcticum]|uniref:Chromatin modification-related protein n=1 Tax=Trichocladium antarcticum TaxID=1450529 RepID=A0AAN6UI14_9PEZI|nr:hypothetical protein BT67DRAFT_383226 [Trichocladium antarcticum]
MKTFKPPAPEGATGSSRRAQPVRQTRINPPRTSSLNRASTLASTLAPEQPLNILPGVTHFTDAITALPKELVRHFTLLKEVDAKIFAPEAALFQLLRDAINTPAPDPNRPPNDASSSIASGSVPRSVQNSSTGAVNPPPPKDSSVVFDPANIPRRTLFRDTALKIQEMLVSLEEKNHVISTANDALQKQLSRIEDVWPHLEAEFSEEAKWGSATHWAYVENRQVNTNDKQAERSRREGAATLSAAAQALAEEAAARSNDRKQAIAAKKNSRNHAADAGADKAQEVVKKGPGGSKARKPLPDSAAPVGLGITAGPPGGAGAPPKRRKVETAKPTGATPMERAMGSVFGANASKQKTTSPRETPAPESGTKKRKALPGSGGQAKKSRTNAAMSPSVTSSPAIGTLPDPAKLGRGSPAPSASAPRPVSSRARQNSTQSNETARQRPPSATSNKPNGISPGTPDLGQQISGAKAVTDAKAQKEAVVSVPNKPIPMKPETEAPPPAPELAQNGNQNENPAKEIEAREPPKKEMASLAIQPTPNSTVKTKSGRTSKPSTPAIGTFAEAATVPTTTTAAPSRSRPSRNNNADSGASTGASSTTTTGPPSTTTTAKRSHKKGASISATAAQAAAAAQQAAAAVATGAAKEKDKDKDKEAGIKKEHQHQSQQPQREREQPGAKNNSSSSNNIINNIAATTNATAAAGAETVADNDDDDDDDDEPEDVDEPLYCYCNQISYGEMVACDGDGCPREWFHLGCVGLKVAPKGNAKWYCEDCKKRVKGGERR